MEKHLPTNRSNSNAHSLRIFQRMIGGFGLDHEHFTEFATESLSIAVGDFEDGSPQILHQTK
jgi:hypothetical protein